MNRYSLFVQCLDKSNPARLRLVSWEKKDQKVHDTRGYQKLAQWSSAIWISGVKCKVRVCDSDRAALQLHRAAHRCFSEISQHGHHFCMKGAVVQRDFGANTWYEPADNKGTYKYLKLFLLLHKCCLLKHEAVTSCALCSCVSQSTAIVATLLVFRL